MQELKLGLDRPLPQPIVGWSCRAARVYAWAPILIALGLTFTLSGCSTRHVQVDAQADARPAQSLTNLPLLPLPPAVPPEPVLADSELPLLAWPSPPEFPIEIESLWMGFGCGLIMPTRQLALENHRALSIQSVTQYWIPISGETTKVVRLRLR